MKDNHEGNEENGKEEPQREQSVLHIEKRENDEFMLPKGRVPPRICRYQLGYNNGSNPL